MNKYFPKENCLSDPSLSWKAKGIFALIVFEGEKTFNELKSISKDGRDSLRNGLSELKNAGFIVAEKKKNPDGTYSETVYKLSEI